MPMKLPQTANCYFCEIIQDGGERWNVLAEDNLTITLLNGRQFEVGQCIVVLRRHAPTILDLSDEESAAIMLTARRASSVLMQAFDPDGILLYQNNGIGTGQEVPHFHLHVVPRREESDWGFGPPHIALLEQGDRPEHRDHARVTDKKRQTVAELRRYFPQKAARCGRRKKPVADERLRE